MGSESSSVQNAPLALGGVPDSAPGPHPPRTLGPSALDKGSEQREAGKSLLNSGLLLTVTKRSDSAASLCMALQWPPPMSWGGGWGGLGWLSLFYE